MATPTKPAKNTTPATALALVETRVETQTVSELMVNNDAIVDIGIAQFEAELETALQQAESAIKPLLTRRTELVKELEVLKPENLKAAQEACATQAKTLIEAFTSLGVVVQTNVSCTGHDNEGVAQALLNVSVTKDLAYTAAQAIQHNGSISIGINYPLPPALLTAVRAIHEIDQKVGVGRVYQVELKQKLGSLERERRRIRSALAEHTLGQSVSGKGMLEVIRLAKSSIPAMPALLALSNGDPVVESTVAE